MILDSSLANRKLKRKVVSTAETVAKFETFTEVTQFFRNFCFRFVRNTRSKKLYFCETLRKIKIQVMFLVPKKWPRFSSSNVEKGFSCFILSVFSIACRFSSLL